MHLRLPSVPTRRVDLVAAAALAIVAAIWQAGPLGPSTLWFDDSWVGVVARVDKPLDAARMGLTSPGFNVGVWLATRLGTSPSAAQALPYLAGVACPPLTYLVGRRIGLSAVAAGLAGVILLASPIQLTYASRVKPYSTEALLALVVIASAWRVVERPSSGRRWAALGVAGAAGILVSSVLAVVTASAFAAALLAMRRRRSSLRPALVTTGLLGVAGLVWYAVHLRTAVHPELHQLWLRAYGVRLDAGIGEAAASAIRVVAWTMESLSGLPGLMLALVIVGVALTTRRHPERTILVAGPLAVAFAFSVAQQLPLGGGRIDNYLLPGLALAGASVVDEIRERLQVPSPGVLAGATVLGLASLVTTTGPEPYPMREVAPLVELLEGAQRSGDGVLVHPHAAFQYAIHTSEDVRIVFDRASWQGFWVEVTAPRTTLLRHPPHDRVVEPTAAAARRHDRLWLLESHTDWHPDLLERIENLLREAGLRVVEEHPAEGARLRLWSRR